MIDLDDPVAISSGDPGGMLGSIAALPEQCREGYRIGRSAPPVSAADVRALAVCGMGGSAVAGDVLRALVAERLQIPVEVVRSPTLPAWCGPGALVVASSYSGDTAETLACFDEALRRRCRSVVVTAGGALRARAEAAGVPAVLVPPGLMPRAAFGYLCLGLLGALEAAGLVPSLEQELGDALEALDVLVPTLVPTVPTSVNVAKRLASAIGRRVPVVWGADGIGAVAASRWKTQFNENAKTPAFAAALPELDHNEVVGWSRGSGSRFFVVALRHDEEHPDVAVRFAPSIEIARDSGALVEEVWASGASRLGKLLSLVAVGDFTSAYLGLVRGADPTPIEAIVRLKAALAEA
ncbi:MAG TPA: bifunctional phosphoglucose/phosphomannose isomerase [Actinomycetota bacterium]|nr:bifunctional phosphoglucose/phosphomannose isomerase [Actinomycetota bacterium]